MGKKTAQNAAPQRECNACEWHGVTDRMLGTIGPLCPECGETTELTAVVDELQIKFEQLLEDNTAMPRQLRAQLATVLVTFAQGHLSKPQAPVKPAAEVARVCTIPPPGWYCTRAPGHAGPCAALPGTAPTTQKPILASGAVPTWQVRLPAPRKQKYCAMNCSGGEHPCEDCGTETIYGDHVAARDAEIADLRAALATAPRQQVHRDALDAARYRWLRDKSRPGICSFYLSVGKAFKDIKFSSEHVDVAIDARIVADQQPVTPSGALGVADNDGGVK